MSQTFRDYTLSQRQAIFYGVCLPTRAIFYYIAYQSSYGHLVALALAITFMLRAVFATNRVWWSRWSHAIIYLVTAISGSMDSRFVAVGFSIDLIYGLLSSMLWMSS